jgi:uncharacterized protein (UPF0264 family)
MPGLIVSVRSACEAEAALAGGATLIDVKEPDHGSLGRAGAEVVAEVVRIVAGRRPVSAALGELSEQGESLPELAGLSYVKWGLAGSRDSEWCEQLRAWRARIEGASPCRVVVAAYGDWRRAGAPQPSEVAWYAVRERAAVLLLDTWHKDGSALLEWLSMGEIMEIREHCRAAGVRLALAGSLGMRDIRTLLPVQPDWFAVRGAACDRGQRHGGIEEARVRELVALLATPTSAG